MIGGQVPAVPTSKEGNPPSLQQCGANGNPCATVEDYPVCDPQNPQDGWVGLSLLMMEDNPQTHVSQICLTPFGAPPDPRCRPVIPFDLPQTKNYDDNELKVILNGRDPQKGNKYFLETRGYAGICRSQNTDTLGLYKMYAYKQRAGLAGFLTLFNEAPVQVALDPYRDMRGFKLTAQEMYGLATCPQLGLNAYDVQCRNGSCPKEQPDGTYGVGDYLFTNHPGRLEPIIAVLRDPAVPISNLSDARRVQLRQHLEGVLEDSPLMAQRKQTKFLDTNTMLAIYGALTTTALVYFIGKEPLQQLWQKFFGLSAERYDKSIKALLKEHPDFDVLGRDAEARQGWRMTDTPGYRGIIINAGTGEGKDEVVKKMELLRQQGDPVVPKEFLKAPAFRLDATDQQAGTELRGSAAGKIKAATDQALKEPTILVISEIDILFASGGSSSGDSETPGKLLLSKLDHPVIKKNLIIFGTTSRGQEMLDLFPDLQRRFNWLPIHSFSVEEIVQIVDTGFTKQNYEAFFGVEISSDAVKAAGYLAENVYRPTTAAASGKPMPRFDAVKKIIEDAARNARDTGAKEVNVAHVLAATEALAGQTVNRDVLPADIQLQLSDAEASLRVKGLSAAPVVKSAAAVDVIPPEVKEMMEKIKAADPQGFGTVDREVLRAVAEHVVEMKQQGHFAGMEGFENGELRPEMLRMVARATVSQARQVAEGRAALRAAERGRESRRVESRWERFKGRLPFVGK